MKVKTLMEFLQARCYLSGALDEPPAACGSVKARFVNQPDWIVSLI